MADLFWIGSVGAGAVCYGAGMLAWYKAPKSPAAGFFTLAMSAIFIAMMTGPLYPMLDVANSDAGNTIAKVFVAATMLALGLLCMLALVFPKERDVRFMPPNRLGGVLIVILIAIIAVGSTATVDYSDPDNPVISKETQMMLSFVSGTLIFITTLFLLISLPQADKQARRSAMIFLSGLWLFGASAIVWTAQVTDLLPVSEDLAEMAHVPIIVGVGVSGFLFAYSIARGEMAMVMPASERLTSKSKAKYRLLSRHAYLVEEPKPEFAFKMFSEILKARCWDCQNDESFPCESLDCSSCKLPCPCRECKKYRSRPQGLVVTRQFPKEVRAQYFLQTTPVIWLSTVAGKDSMDPAKLSLLTDSLVNFMEKSQNGVVLVEGIEYLVTSNDFLKMLKSIDRWTETAMTSNSRLVISLDPRAFEPRELAMIERNREAVRPDAAEEWKIIPERI